MTKKKGLKDWHLGGEPEVSNLDDGVDDQLLVALANGNLESDSQQFNSYITYKSVNVIKLFSFVADDKAW